MIYMIQQYSNKAILVNMLFYEETVVRRGEKIEATQGGLKAMSFTRYFGKGATKSLFGENMKF